MNNRPLELHVWGPAFGLPSIDPESAAAIAYLKQSLRPEHYRLLQNSPSGVPTRMTSFSSRNLLLFSPLPRAQSF